ncbi:MAG: acyl-CoA thioesterase [Anaerolineae bacterium]
MTSTQNHPFDAALQFQYSNNRYQGKTSPDYANMVGPFGGITAAAMLKSMLDHPDRQGDPITLTVNFAAPIKDGDYEIEAQATRTGRSTQHWFGTMRQGDEIVTTATAVFAIRRETWGATDLHPPAMSDLTKRFSTGVMPPWTEQYRFHMAHDMADIMSDDSPTSETVQSIQDNPPRPLDFLSLTAMSDVFIPRIFVRRGGFVPAGTVAFTVYFHTDSAALAEHGDAGMVGRARANRFYNRFFDQSAEIWTPSGDLLATSNQIVYFKE